MKLLMVYPPFCNPSTFPYSISYLKAFVRNNSDIDVSCIDLNAKLHKKKFSSYYGRLDGIKAKKDFAAYAGLIDDFTKETRKYYSAWNKSVISGGKLDMLDECFAMIIEKKPDYVAFSLVYNSQCFFAFPLMEKLIENGIECICGGPAVNEIFRARFTCLKNEFELLDHINGKRTDYDCSTVPDFSDYLDDDYLAMDIIVPLKSCSTCYYRQCAFCTHYKDSNYYEYDLALVRKSVERTGKKHFFFIDDMISRKRLLEIASIMKDNGSRWWCQLKPNKELIPHIRDLYDSGLRGVSWGVESGSQKMLDRMKKGTNAADIEKVLEESKNAGIKNTAFIIFGFPGETKTDFLETIDFLKRNDKNIDLCSTSVFGLQKGSKVFDNPSSYGVLDIVEHKRTILNSKITYGVQDGMSQEEANLMVKKYSKTLKKLNKLPAVYNYFREQVIFLD